ncbi:MAG: GtrA family protein [Myxococcales bacterium]|nr:GtrA family protein [Myxococcales bacterium]
MTASNLFKAAWVVVRSAGVGLCATATDLIALAVLVSGFGLSPRIASVPALALGIAIQFVGNKWFAFADRSPNWVRQGAQFLGVESLGFVANLVLFDLALTHTHLPYLPLRLVTTNLVYFALCLPLWSLIFRPAPQESS